MSDGDVHLWFGGHPTTLHQAEGAKDLVIDARWVHRFQ